MQSRKFSTSDLKSLMDKVSLTKIPSELASLRIASSFVSWAFSKLVGEVEDIIDGEKKVRHAHIQKNIEGLLEKDAEIKPFLEK